MAENSKIEWTHHTFNPWLGCTKVSPACKNCYAERDFDHRLRQVQWGPNGTRVLTSDANWAKPLKWNRDVEKEYEIAQAQWVADCCVGTKSYPEPELDEFRKRVFCASLADVFEDWQGSILNSKGEQIHKAWHHAQPHWVASARPCEGEPLTMNDVRQRLFALIDATPNLDWLLLTKRPENILRMCMWPIHPSGLYQEGMSFAESHRRSNVWLGCSVENQEYADRRIPELLKCRDLSPVLFLSCEPLLGPVQLCDLERQSEDGQAFDWLSSAGINWVIAGGESGPEARPSDPQWFRSLRDQCKEGLGVPFLFKQWGEHDENLHRVGKSKAGRMLDGVSHDEFPRSSPSPRTA